MIAITRAVSPAIVRCELTFFARQSIDYAKAAEQHRAYERMLESLGASVISLPVEPELPDSMFVEDTAVVLDEVAVVLPLGTESRRPEALSVERTLASYRPIERINLPGAMEGGDVLRIGRKLFVGISSRTNLEGLRQLDAIVSRYGYTVSPVFVSGCLHLKSACTYLGRNTVLANREWIDSSPLAGYDWIDVAPDEPHAANALALGDTVIFPASFPRTHERIESHGFCVIALDISELQKAESGLTCSSLLISA